MNEPKKNRWTQDYEGLPGQFKRFVDAFKKVHGYGYNFQGFLGDGKHVQLFVLLTSGDADALFPAVIKMKEFCDALSAPAEHPALEGYGSECKCQYLDIVPHEAICRCYDWPDKNYKCNRTWDEGDYCFDSCPGFAPNKNYKEPTP